MSDDKVGAAVVLGGTLCIRLSGGDVELDTMEHAGRILGKYDPDGLVWKAIERAAAISTGPSAFARAMSADGPAVPPLPPNVLAVMAESGSAVVYTAESLLTAIQRIDATLNDTSPPHAIILDRVETILDQILRPRANP